MKKFILSALVCGLTTFCSAFNDLDKTLQKYYQENAIKGNPQKVSDSTWLKRVYLSIGGRIPTLNETEAFTKDTSPVKKEKTLEKLLYSEDYVNNIYNFWADLLRIRPERLSDDVGLLKSYPYMDFVRESIRQDKPYNKFVYEMLTSEGRYSDNGATGYYLRDNGMPLDNLATTLQIFIATDLSCAQCHDDPFQDFTQKQFYEMAGFFTTLNNRESRKEYGEVLKKVDADIKAITKTDRIDNNVRQLLSSNLFNLKDDDNKMIKLPHDYKYNDSKPFDIVQPVSLDGKYKNPDKDKRETISKWIIEHPNFSLAMSNRIWEFMTGTPLIQSTVNFNVSEYKEGKILVHLGDYFKNSNYSIKSLIRYIASSDFYSRVAYTGNLTDYKYQSVLVQRLSSYQLWDSLLTLSIPDVNYSKYVYSKYSDLIEIDWNNITGQGLLDKMESIRSYDRELNNNTLKYKNIDLVRACFVGNRNSFVGQFLREYGASDRILIDTTDNNSSITQVLTIMNSPVVDLLTTKESFLMNTPKEKVFSAVLVRQPSLNEKNLIASLDQKDLIWVLINSREFLFKQ